MREIKYRQRLSNDTWHYWGFIGKGRFVAPVLNSETFEDALKHSQQYTGLKDKKDKNDKEIYEGDVVGYKNQVNDEIITAIEWNNKCSGWFANRGGRLADLIHEQTVLRKKDFNLEPSFEVIGNIYENPELIK